MSPAPEEAAHEQNLRAAVTSARRRLFYRNSHVSFALNALANWLVDRRRYAEAEPLYREAVSLQRQSKPSHALVICLNNLAWTLHLQAKFAESEPLFVEAVTLARQLLAPESEDIGLVCQRLIGLYIDTAQFAQAEHLARELVENYRQVLTVPHGRFVAALYNLGSVCRVLGKSEEAEQLLNEAREKGHIVFPDGVDLSVEILNELGYFHSEHDDLSRAEVLHREALELCEKVLPPDALHRSICYDNLASVAFGQEEYEQAAEYSRKAIEIDQAGGLQETSFHATHLMTLAGAYHKLWRNEDAESLLRQALEIDRTTLPSHSVVHGERLELLAAIYQEQERYAEAEKLFLKVLEIKRKAFPSIHDGLRATLENLGDFYLDQGKYEESEHCLTEALDITRGLKSEDATALMCQLRDLAHLYHDAGWYDKAEPIYREAMELMLEELGDEHSETEAFIKDRIQFDLDRKMAKEEQDELPL